MSSEKYNQIVDEAYENYLKNWKPQPVVENELYWMEQELVSDKPLPKDMFIFCIKKDSDFSEKWGLKIEERELNVDERKDIWNKDNFGQDMSWHNMIESDVTILLNEDNIPTKLITLTYNEQTIASYE